MPIPCARCLLLEEKGEPVVYHITPGYSRYRECARRGNTHRDASSAEEVVRLERAIAKVTANKVEALDTISKLTSELRATSSRLERSRKQKVLLQRRGGLILNKKAQSIKNLEELDRLEAAREAGGPVDPKNAKEERSPKRLRGAALASNAVESSQSVGSPGVGSGSTPPEGSGLVDQARLSPFPKFDFGSFVYDESAVLVDLGFGDGTHQ
ncbi:hypothetical protein MPH_13331 [Macrophomina phaseolina MS6]|uniref:Uncharacterized protein n=1 Tax=Macrophomina phaseolina (strain MS6) TaxID=1126212 RepID=K2R640_MACPH|nr:hypothetical protein MPH_13331 [Macrophomina phaseolina MS6]